MSGFGWFWVALTLVQLAVAGYAFAAVASWRGERLWPEPGHPLARWPVVVAATVYVALVALVLWVGDVEFARYLGTGAVMVAAVVLIVQLLRRQARDA